MGAAYQDVVRLDVGVEDVAAFEQLQSQEELLDVGADRLDVDPHILPILLQHLPQVHTGKDRRTEHILEHCLPSLIKSVRQLYLCLYKSFRFRQ